MTEPAVDLRMNSGSSRRVGPVWLAVGSLLVAHMILAWLIREPGITARNDDAVYLFLSRSLREFDYRNLFSATLAPHVQYPPGYPAFLAGLTLVFGERIDLFLAVGILCSAFGLGLVFDLLRRRISTEMAFLVIVPSALNPWMLRLAGTLIAEPVYFFLSALALWLLEREVARSRTGAGTAAALAMTLMRSAGIMLPGAIGLWLLLQRRWRPAAGVAAATAVVFGSWFGWMVSHPVTSEVRERSYVATLDAASTELRGRYVAERIPVARAYLTVNLPQNLPVPRVWNNGKRWGQWGTLAGLLCALGLVALWRPMRLTALYLAGYLLLLLAWPVESLRFLVVIVPFIIATLMLGVELLCRRAPPRLGQAVMLGLAGLLVAGGLEVWQADRLALAKCDRGHPLEQPGCFPEEVRSYFLAASRMAAIVPADEPVVALQEPSVSYYSGRRIVALSRIAGETSAEFLDELRGRQADYVLLGHSRGMEVRRLAPDLAEGCRYLDQLLFVPPHAYLFRVRPADSPTSDRTACESLIAYLADPPTTAPVRK